MEPAVQQKIEKFFSSYPQKVYKEDKEIIKPYDSPDGVFLLIKGTVRMNSISPKGMDVTLNIFKPLSFFPVGWAINATENKYSYVAVDDVAVRIVPKKEFVEFLKSNHDVVFDLLTRIYKGLEGYFQRMEVSLTGEAYTKMITHLLIHTRRFGPRIDLTHAQIASLAGLSRETVTRELKKLQNKKIVTYEGNTLIILDIALLEKEQFAFL